MPSILAPSQCRWSVYISFFIFSLQKGILCKQQCQKHVQKTSSSNQNDAFAMLQSNYHKENPSFNENFIFVFQLDLNDFCYNQQEMKLIWLAILLVLTCQKNPLADRTFRIIANSLGENDLNNILVTFYDGSLEFKSCDLNAANYQIGKNSSLKVGSWIYTLIFCVINKDELLRQLLSRVIQYQLNGNELTLVNGNKEKSLILTELLYA